MGEQANMEVLSTTEREIENKTDIEILDMVDLIFGVGEKHFFVDGEDLCLEYGDIRAEGNKEKIRKANEILSARSHRFRPEEEHIALTIVARKGDLEILD